MCLELLITSIARSVSMAVNAHAMHSAAMHFIVKYFDDIVVVFHVFKLFIYFSAVSYRTLSCVPLYERRYIKKRIIINIIITRPSY